MSDIEVARPLSPLRIPRASRIPSTRNMKRTTSTIPFLALRRSGSWSSATSQIQNFLAQASRHGYHGQLWEEMLRSHRRAATGRAPAVTGPNLPIPTHWQRAPSARTRQLRRNPAKTTLKRLDFGSKVGFGPLRPRRHRQTFDGRATWCQHQRRR